MAILEHELRSAKKSALTGLHRHLLSLNEYHSMVTAGVFDGYRLEMIEGELVDMAPIGPAHAAITDPLYTLLRDAFGPRFLIRNQSPISLSDDDKPSEPQPDIAVVSGSWRNYLTHHPGPEDIKLVVEVSDSTLGADRTVKAGLYAAAGIPEYWIVNLIDNCVEVHLMPTSGSYSVIRHHGVNGTVEPLSAPGKTIAVADFMP